MAKDIPIVCKALLDDPFLQGPPIPLDSPQWFEWLDLPDNNRFSYAYYNHKEGYIDGFMTVRKEARKRGTYYWSAYRRHGPTLYKRYVGLSQALTLHKLEEIARQMLVLTTS